MPNQVLKLPLQNERLEPITVLLEPLSESFTIDPGKHVEIYAIFDSNTSNTCFTIAPNDSFLTIYAPGEIAGFVDCYIIFNGVRLEPDGN